MNRYEARPTEYKGIRFRSKSEAVFARALDLAGADFRYEPQTLKTPSEYVPDFVAKFCLNDEILRLVIEYKPSEPTKVYVDSLMDEFSWLKTNVLPENHSTFYLLMVGSPYNSNEKYTMHFIGKHYLSDGVLFRDSQWSYRPDWTGIERHIDNAKSYRFDLKH